MGVRIIVDSAADLGAERAAEWDVRVLPLKTNIGGVEYLDGVNITNEEFFEKLVEMSDLPVTSAIAPGEYAQAFREELEAGNEVVLVSLSSKLSACYSSALIAAGEFPDAPLHIVDSMTVTLGEYLLVQRAVQMRDEGLSAAQIAENLETEKKNVRLVALVDTLEYLKRGGRVSPTLALVGGLLNIKPVIAVENGEVKVLGQARGSKNGRNLLVEQARKSGGIDYGKPYIAAYSGLSDKLVRKYLADSADHFPIDVNEIPVCTIGSTIGTHVGPGAVGVAFFSREA